MFLASADLVYLGEVRILLFLFVVKLDSPWLNDDLSGVAHSTLTLRVVTPGKDGTLALADDLRSD